MSDNQPRWIAGDRFRDHRGVLSFFNDFDLVPYVRFYCIQTNKTRTVRAWQGHQFEHKAFYCIKGRVRIAAVQIDDWETPSPELTPRVFELSAEAPGVLHIPGGWANGIQPLCDDAQIIVFSDTALHDSKNDDIRFHSTFWNVWDT